MSGARSFLKLLLLDVAVFVIQYLRSGTLAVPLGYCKAVAPVETWVGSPVLRGCGFLVRLLVFT